MPVAGDSYKQHDLLKRIKAQDEQVLKHLYVNNFPNVRKYILNNSGTEEDAKDIYQEAFLSAWRNVILEKVTLQHDAAMNAYIYRIAKNKWIDVLRATKRQVSMEDELDIADAVADVYPGEDEHMLDLIKRHFLRMGSPCKELLQKFYFYKESLRQIATHFSWTEPTAKNNKYRCLQKLRAVVLNDL